MKGLTVYVHPCENRDMNTNTATRKASALQVGDMIATTDNKFRKVTDIDITPAAIRIRTGRSQHWMRAKHDATFTVAA